MVEKILIGEMLGEYGITSPMELADNAVAPQEFRHTDMQIPVGVKQRGDGKLCGNDRSDTKRQDCDKECSARHNMKYMSPTGFEPVSRA